MTMEATTARRRWMNAIEESARVDPLTEQVGKLADWSADDRRSIGRLGAMHAGLNGLAAATFAMSWWCRRSQWRRGVALGAVGMVMSSAAGLIGGHMAFELGAGVGPRGVDEPPADASDGG